MNTLPSAEALSRSNATSRQPLVARSSRWIRKMGLPNCTRRRSATKSVSPPASLLSCAITPAGLSTTAICASAYSTGNAPSSVFVSR